MNRRVPLTPIVVYGVAALILLFLVALRVRAGRDLDKPDKPVEKLPAASIYAGAWVQVWSNTPYDMTLEKGGDYKAIRSDAVKDPNPTTWVGSWKWDEKARMLSVEETQNAGQTWLIWSVRLDAQGSGVGDNGVAITIKRPEDK